MFDITSSLGQSQQGLDQLQFVDVAQHRVSLLGGGGGGGPLQDGVGGEGGGGEGDNLKHQSSTPAVIYKDYFFV